MAGLGRTVLARQRMSRLWGLGDRVAPSAHTPGLVVTDDAIDDDDFGFSETTSFFQDAQGYNPETGEDDNKS